MSKTQPPGVIRARAFYRLWRDDVALFVISSDQQSGKRWAAVDVSFEDRTGMIAEPEPTISLSMESAQELMGSLWDAGVRPPQARVGDGQAKHLEDMRAIAFAKLNVEKP